MEYDAGPELDRLIALYLMNGVINPYSTEMNDAWEVVMQLNRLKSPWRIELTQLGYPPRGWRCTVFQSYVAGGIEVRAETAPLAICRAALQAIDNS